MYNSTVEGMGGIVARVVADSVSESGKRITTFELEYHRFIHSELMTHRLFSRNAMSSRAVPISKMIEQVRERPAMPIHWGANQAGMQSEHECDNAIDLGAPGVLHSRIDAWSSAARISANHANVFSEAGYHKQIVNRLLEPFQMMKTVLTATEFDNFFHLRRHKDAQPEIQELANCMYEAMQKSDPELLHPGEWHTPYVEHERDIDDELRYVTDDCDFGNDPETALKVSASCCAQVSYRMLDDSLDKALMIYEKLVESKPIHASPFEHQATPMLHEWDHQAEPMADIDGMTHQDSRGYYWSGNLKGWIQNRQLINGHTVWSE